MWWRQAFANAGWNGTERDAMEFLREADTTGKKAPEISAKMESLDRQTGIMQLSLTVTPADYPLPDRFQGSLAVASYQGGASYSGPSSRTSSFVLEKGEGNIYAGKADSLQYTDYRYQCDGYPAEGFDYPNEDPQKIIQRIAILFGQAAFLMSLIPRTPTPKVTVE